MPAPRPCIECGRRPKALPRQRCATCQLRHEPIDVQVAASRARLAMVPPELRKPRSGKTMRHAPEGTAWCAACQTFRDDDDFGRKATTCRACLSARTHGAMIAKTYNLTAAQYDALLELQGRRCAICRARPKSKRLAVDHDHQTGAVRGLLCSRCNHDLMGAAWDSSAMAHALLGYILEPPTSGIWVAPELAAPFVRDGALRPSAALEPESALVVTHSGKGAHAPAAPQRRTILPDGWETATAPELHAAWAALEGRLRVVDPAPF